MKKEGVLIILLLVIVVGIGVIIIQNKFKNSLSNQLDDIQDLKVPQSNLSNTIQNMGTKAIGCSAENSTSCSINGYTNNTNDSK